MLHLELSGTPKERGETHGEHFRIKIREMAELRRDLFETYFAGFSDDFKQSVISEGLKALKLHTHLYTEFLGISDASGVSEADLLILNNYTDMRDFSWRDKNSVSLQDGGCSVFSVRGKTERICGQTWDMDATALPYVVHLSLKASDKSELSSEVFSLTGCLGLSGVNSKSVGVFINNLHCRETGNGLAWPALVRGMLNQDSAASALKFMETHLPASGHNYLICDPKETLNVESTGQRVVVTARSSSPGAIFHTNHYVDPSLKDQEISERRSLTTHGRYGALETFFRGFKFDGFTYDSVAQGVFEGETGKTVSIPLPPAARHDIKKAPAAVTCGGILVDLVARTGELYAGVYADGDRRAIRW